MANKKRKASANKRRKASAAADLPKKVRKGTESITGGADISETDVNAIATAASQREKTLTGEQSKYYFTRTVLIAAQKAEIDAVEAPHSTIPHVPCPSEVMPKKIEFSPAMPIPPVFDVQKRIQ